MKLKQCEAATIIGVHFTYLSQILSGRRPSIGLSAACNIEDATGIPVRAWLPTKVDSPRRKWSSKERKQRVGKE